MAILKVSLPDDAQHWVDGQVQSGLFLDESDVVRHLIRCEMVRADKHACVEPSSIVEGETGGNDRA